MPSRDSNAAAIWRLHQSAPSGCRTSMLARRVRTDGFVAPCIPTLAAKPPTGQGGIHEIKHDGYRRIVRRDGKAVRLFTRRGHDGPLIGPDPDPQPPPPPRDPAPP